MATIKYIQPARKGLIVRNPNNMLRPLPEEGQNVVWSSAWARIERDGDIIVSPQRKYSTKAVKPTETKTKKEDK